MIWLPVTSKELVLEIGSGHNPHPRSDILVDRWLYQDRERQRKVIKIDRPTIIADGCKLPFTNQSFDFVLCNQVIEHVEKPDQFVKEIARVAKRGLIITPHLLRERIFGWHYHRWFIDMKDDFLYFYPKKETQQTQFAHFIHVLYAHIYNFRHFIDSLDKKINIYYQWEKDIKIKISDDPEKILNIYDKKAGELLQQVTYSLKNLINQWASEKYERVVNCCYYWYEKIVRFKFRKVLKANIIKNLCCLKCGSQSISNKDKLLVCQKCKQTYILENGIPIMLNKHDLSKGY